MRGTWRGKPALMWRVGAVWLYLQYRFGWRTDTGAGIWLLFSAPAGVSLSLGLVVASFVLGIYWRGDVQLAADLP